MANKKLEAITVTRPVFVAGEPAARGAVFKIPGQLPENDARYLVAIGKAVFGEQSLTRTSADPAKSETSAKTAER